MIIRILNWTHIHFVPSYCEITINMKDLRKFEQIYIHNWEKLYAFCYKMTRDNDLSQNIVQDLFTDLWERKEEVQILSIENYLFRAAKNQVLKEYRRNKFDTTSLDESFEHYLVEHSPVGETELVDKLHNLLQHLPDKRKEILIMNKLDQMDIEEIALLLNISKQTVKNQISTALKQLKFHAKAISILLFTLFLI